MPKKPRSGEVQFLFDQTKLFKSFVCFNSDTFFHALFYSWNKHLILFFFSFL